MKKRFNEIVSELENHYSSVNAGNLSVMKTLNGKEYHIRKPNREIFNTITAENQKKNFRIAAIDGGVLPVYETPTWCIVYYKLAFRLFDVDLVKKTCKTAEKEIVHDIALLSTKKEINEFENNEFLVRREKEFTLKQLKKLDMDTLLLIDGALDSECWAIIKQHPHVIGISKKTKLSIGRYSATAYIKNTAENLNVKSPWFCYPLVKTYPGETSANIVFGKFRETSPVFRIDTPQNISKETLQIYLEKTAICSGDPKYRHYPYPLGVVHSDAVMRKDDKEKLKRFVKREISRNNGKFVEMLKQDLADADWYDSMRKRS